MKEIYLAIQRTASNSNRRANILKMFWIIPRGLGDAINGSYGECVRL